MYLKTLMTAVAATALFAGAVQAQSMAPPVDPANAPVSADAMSPPAPPEGTMVDPGLKTTEAAAVNAVARDSSAVVTTSVVTNGPVADTPANRAKYGQPVSNAGKRTAAKGN
ncbi:hypothetical protein [Phenylobacterium sp.]|uniref:hypothetical protein n=1 Tax=Phenylobacterium sp. TaxID=1871053 RepID=UPI00286BC5D9|nr:hypothetical protein [Phenylobacterium sp.]